MKKLLSVMAIFLMAAVVAFPPAAHAVTALYLTDGVNSVTINDGGVGDSNPVVGAITYIGGVGANWTVNVTTGLTKPVLTSPLLMDLNSVDVSSVGAGTLTLIFSDQNWNFPAAATGIMHVSGTTVGTFTYDAYYESNNVLGIPAAPTTVLPGAQVPIGTVGPSVGPAFSGTATGPIPQDGEFSLTQVVTIQHLGIGATSINAALNVPVPATALLLGTGLLGLVGLRYRRKRKS